jgi:hypothetical protein
MKKIVFFAVALLLALSQPARADEDTDYNARVAAAKVYLQTMSAEKMVDQMMEALAKSPQSHLTVSDLADIKSSIDIAALNKTMLGAMSKHSVWKN